MVEKKIVCRDCKKEFVTKVNLRYMRKYCADCSAERKKAYEKIHLIKIEDCED